MLLRISPDQHNAKFDSRTRLVLRNFDIAKMPLDDLAKEAPIRLMKAEQDPSKASSADHHSLQVAALDTASEALELGLSAPNSKALQKEAATKAKARAKKRTQDEIAADELQKAREEFDGLLKSLGAMFDGKAFGNELGKVDRSVQRKLRECADNHWFEIKEPLKKMCSDIEAIRQAVKVAKSFSGGAAAAKKHGKEFLETMQKVADDVPRATEFCKP